MKLYFIKVAKFNVLIPTVRHFENVVIYVTGFTKTVLISTRNEIQFIADY